MDTSSIDKGEPHPELDNVWKDIFLNANIRLSKDEMQKINKTAPVELYDGSGYYGQLSVYHHLHCLVCSLVTTRSFDRSLLSYRDILEIFFILIIIINAILPTETFKLMYLFTLVCRLSHSI